MGTINGRVPYFWADAVVLTALTLPIWGNAHLDPYLAITHLEAAQL